MRISPALVDRKFPAPLYAQVRRALLDAILRGELQQGERLPGELELTKQLGVSQITVRRALRDLADSGYLQRRPGRGTVVARSKVMHFSGKIAGVTTDLANQGIVATSRVLEHSRRVMPSDVADAMQRSPGEEVLVDRRVIIAGGEPLSLVASYHALPASIALTDDEIRNDFVVRLLRTRFGYTFRRATRTMEANSATAEDAELLCISKGSPILCAELVIFADGPAALSLVRARYRGDRYQYHQEIAA